MNEDALTCPHCGGRLVAGATICLHCNEEVSASATSSDSEGALGRFMITAIVVIAVIGGASVFLMQAITGDDTSSSSSKASADTVEGRICVDETKESQVNALQARGLKEIKAKKGERCFEEKEQ